MAWSLVISVGDGREQGHLPELFMSPHEQLCIACWLAAVLGPRAVPLKAGSSPLCLCLLSGLSLRCSWWDPLARAPGKFSALLIGTPGPTPTSACWGWAGLRETSFTQEQEMPTLPLLSLPVTQGRSALPWGTGCKLSICRPLFTQHSRQEVAAGHCHAALASLIINLE